MSAPTLHHGWFQEWSVLECGLLDIALDPKIWPLIDLNGRASLPSVRVVAEQCLMLVMKDSFQLIGREVESGRVRQCWN
jgi:hypothetical protein